jgi:hypothetical protein
MLGMICLAALALVLAYWWTPRLTLAVVTNEKISSRTFMQHEVYDEIRAELNARKLVKEVRRQAKTRRQEGDRP